MNPLEHCMNTMVNRYTDTEDIKICELSATSLASEVQDVEYLSEEKQLS